MPTSQSVALGVPRPQALPLVRRVGRSTVSVLLAQGRDRDRLMDSSSPSADHTFRRLSLLVVPTPLSDQRSPGATSLGATRDSQYQSNARVAIRHAGECISPHL